MHIAHQYTPHGITYKLQYTHINVCSICHSHVFGMPFDSVIYCENFTPVTEYYK